MYSKKHSILGDSNLRWRWISSFIGIAIAIMVLVFLMLMTGCASQTKPLPIYKQVEVPTVKAYQEKVNHVQNYVYRADHSARFKSLSESMSEKRGDMKMQIQF
ncbi:hypothetical protein [Fastidiosibacter lacustris]|uniref:hypothetical protein n=1 Tax=Fastidiosibacter lacustris TaxID=2056695 RepID=UPI000E352598|nr:hypothetical protein [Fastidiosibacter lacustris]